MRFFTIRQYFNKLQSALFVLLIVPLLFFSALYLYRDGKTAEASQAWIIVILLAVLLNWLVGTILVNKKIKSARHAQGLGVKLEKYFGLTVVRFAFLTSSGLMLALGFFLTGSDIFTGIYFGGLLLSAGVWPTSRRACRQLRLRGAEREMVYFMKDSF